MNLDPELVLAVAAHPMLGNTTQQIMEGGVSLQDHTRKVERENMEEVNKFHAGRLPPATQYTVKDTRIPVEGGDIPVRCLIPEGGSDEKYPVLMWAHGGGWMAGSIDQDDYQLRSICVELKVTIVNVEYRLAPEHEFPVAFNDCYAALSWVANNTSELRASLSKGFLVGGDSAGGNLAAAVALKARDDPIFAGKQLTGQYLREPVLLHPSCHPEKYKSELQSLNLFSSTPILNTDGLHFCCGMYKPSPPSDLRMSPLLASSQAGLPPAFLQVMGNDPLRDEGLLYERLLREAGVKTKFLKHDGLVHGTHYFFPALPSVLEVDRGMREGLKWLLSLTE